MTVENKRVYELAKEFGMSNKDFIEYLDTKLDIKVKSHSSNLLPAQIDKIKASFSKNNDAEPAKKPKAFIIKKAKPAPSSEETPKEEVKEEKSSHKKETVQPVKKAAAGKQQEQKSEKKETVKETEPINSKSEEQTKPEETDAPKIRSLLEYNNRNSQKRRQEMFANKQRAEKAEAEKNTETKKDFKSARPVQKTEQNRQDRNDKRPAFDKTRGERKPEQQK